MDRIKLNVSGTHFEFSRNILNENKSPKLTKLCSEHSRPGEVPLTFSVDRSPLSFRSILDYCQTGELHIPYGVCPGAFRRELEFWEVDQDSLHDCCLHRYHAFMNDEETRRNFLHKAIPLTTAVAPILTTPDAGIIHRCRRKVWRVIDNHEDSLPAKLYFVLVSLLVVISICVLAYSTEPDMRRHLSKCELLEYLESIEHADLQKIETILGNPDCSGSGSFFSTADFDDDYMMDVEDYDWSYFEFKSGLTLDAGGELGTTPPPNNHVPKMSDVNDRNKNDEGKNDVNEKAVDENADDLDDVTEAPKKISIHIPKLTLPKPIFNLIDMIVNVLFTIDFILRITSCPSVRRYFMSVINILDALALFATFVYIIIVSVEKEYLYKKTPMLMLLEFVQVFRALRLFRVVKNVRASKVLGYCLTQDLRDMSLLVTLLFVGVTTFAYLLYVSESLDTVNSIPKAWYWAIVTMTTVGYGDISPKTGLGRVVASICAICGVLLLSVTLPMFVNNFLTLYQYSCVNESIDRKKAEKKTDSSKKAVSDVASETIVTPISMINFDRPPTYTLAQKSVNHEIE